MDTPFFFFGEPQQHVAGHGYSISCISDYAVRCLRYIYAAAAICSQLQCDMVKKK
jgi:hypothetical protein